MRIIAGEFKGRILNAPRGKQIRPTADKVKEAVFSMIDMHVNGATVIDLFAGSGNLGLEALSRGAKVCYFGDNSPYGIKLLSSNIDICGASDRSVVLAGDFEKVLMKIPGNADIIFLDPPYNKGLIKMCLSKIYENGVLSEGGVIVAEHSKEDRLPETVSHFTMIKQKKYGTILVSIFS